MITKRDVIMKFVILQSLLHLYAHHSTFDFIVARHICICFYFKQHNKWTLVILCLCVFYNTAVWCSVVGLEDTLVSLIHLSSPRRALDSRHRGNAIVCDEVTLVAILTCESRVVGCGTVPTGVAHVAIVRRDVGAVAVLRGKLMMRELPHVHIGVGCHHGGGCTSTGTGCRLNVADNSATPTGTAASTATAGAATIRRWWCPGSGQFEFSVRFLYRTEDICDGKGRGVRLVLMVLFGAQGHRQISTIKFRKQAMEVRRR